MAALLMSWLEKKRVFCWGLLLYHRHVPCDEKKGRDRKSAFSFSTDTKKGKRSVAENDIQTIDARAVKTKKSCAIRSLDAQRRRQLVVVRYVVFIFWHNFTPTQRTQRGTYILSHATKGARQKLQKLSSRKHFFVVCSKSMKQEKQWRYVYIVL